MLSKSPTGKPSRLGPPSRLVTPQPPCPPHCVSNLFARRPAFHASTVPMRAACPAIWVSAASTNVYGTYSSLVESQVPGNRSAELRWARDVHLSYKLESQMLVVAPESLVRGWTVKTQPAPTCLGNLLVSPRQHRCTETVAIRIARYGKPVHVAGIRRLHLPHRIVPTQSDGADHLVLAAEHMGLSASHRCFDRCAGERDGPDGLSFSCLPDCGLRQYPDDRAQLGVGRTANLEIPAVDVGCSDSHGLDHRSCYGHRVAERGAPSRQRCGAGWSPPRRVVGGDPSPTLSTCPAMTTCRGPGPYSRWLPGVTSSSPAPTSTQQQNTPLTSRCSEPSSR